MLTARRRFNFYSLWHFSTLQRRDALSLWHLTEFDTLSTLFLGWEGALVQGFLATRVASVSGRVRRRVNERADAPAQLIITQAHKQLFILAVCVGTTISLLGSWLYVSFTTKIHQGRLHAFIPVKVAEGVSTVHCAVVRTRLIVFCIYRCGSGAAHASHWPSRAV